MPTTVKLNDAEAKLLREVRAKILREGVTELDKVPAVCPRCYTLVPGAKLSESWECPSCQYKWHGISIGKDGKIVISDLVGVATMALVARIGAAKE